MPTTSTAPGQRGSATRRRRRRHLAHLLALTTALGLLAAGSAQAARLVGSAQIRDGSLTGRDLRDRSLTGDDLRRASLPRARVAQPRCFPETVPFLAGCVTVEHSNDLKSYVDAMATCDEFGGRLPTAHELRYLATGTELDTAVFEWSSTALHVANVTVVLRVDEAGEFAPIEPAGSLTYAHHCVLPADAPAPRR